MLWENCNFQDFLKFIFKVYLVSSKTSSNELYAMKALKKDQVLQNDNLESAIVERDVFKLGNNNPYLAKLYCTFQNEVGNDLYIISFS